MLNSTKRSCSALLLGTSVLALLTSPAFAQQAPADVNARINRLEQSIQDQQAEITALKAQLSQAQAAPAAPTPVAAPAGQPPVTVALPKNGRLTISSADGKYTFTPRALVQSDYGIYSKDVVAGTSINASGENFRRAQIGFQGTLAGDFSYRFAYDFGGTNGDETYQAYVGTKGTVTSTGTGTGPHIQQAWVGYKGILAPFTFQIGALPPPVNLGDATASDDLLFNERASPSQLSRSLGGDDGRDGLGLSGSGSFWYASTFLTGNTAGKGSVVAPANSQEAIVARVAFFPWYDPTTNFNVHFGGNYTDVLLPQETTSCTTVPVCTTVQAITFSDRPELRVDNVTFLNTGAIPATGAYTAGVEAAVSWGPFLLEGENFWYGITRLNPAAGVTNPSFGGWYVDASWVVTGEFRKYNTATASYTRPSPANPFDPANNHWGAWELAARYSSSDLNYDKYSTVTADRVFGGTQNVLTGGVNFYPNDIVKFMFDYQDVTLKDIGAIGKQDTFSTFNVRAQVSY